MIPRAAAPFVVVPVVVVATAVPDVVADEPPDDAGEVAEEAALVALEVALAVRVTPCVRTRNVREGSSDGEGGDVQQRGRAAGPRSRRQ